MLALLSLLFVPAVLAHNTTLSRRYSNIYMSNYFASQGVGACGQSHSDEEYVVALSTDNYNNGQYCNQEIYITYNGMSAVAKIVDECMGCPEWGLDFSQGLFGHFVGGEQNDNNVGIIYGDWVFGTGPSNDADTTTTKKATPTTTTKHTTSPTPTPTTTHTTTTTSTTTHSSSAQPTSSSAQQHSSSAPTASPPAQSGATASPSAPASTATSPQNLYTFTNTLLNLLELVVQAPGAA